MPIIIFSSFFFLFKNLKTKSKEMEKWNAIWWSSSCKYHVASAGVSAQNETHTNFQNEFSFDFPRNGYTQFRRCYFWWLTTIQQYILHTYIYFITTRWCTDTASSLLHSIRSRNIHDLVYRNYKCKSREYNYNVLKQLVL